MGGQSAVATPHAWATEAGARAIRAGGNAIDAALAAAITTAVVYPHQTSAGGDLVALVRTPDGETVCINATGWAAAAVDAAALTRQHGMRMPSRDIASVTVPGAPAGWRALHELGARLPWEQHFTSAIRIAREGFHAGHSLAFCLALMWDTVGGDEGIAGVFAPDGAPIMRGDRVIQPALAETLTTIALQGAQSFYQGEIARSLVRTLNDRGSALALDDFAAYDIERTAPLGTRWQGLEVLTSPPNTQGFALLRTLRALASDAADSERVRAMAQAFLEGNAVRLQHLADPRFERVDLDRLLEGAAPVGEPAPLPPRGDTIGLAAADSEGYAVSIIQSLFELFGSGVLDPATGVTLQNRGSMFSLDPESPNLIAARKRPAHTLMPVMALQEGRLRYVNASMGGYSQPQIHTQLLQHLEDGAAPQTAVDSPRWILGPQRPNDADDVVYAEAGVPAATIAELRSAGYPVVAVPDRTELLGHANVIALSPTGTLTAGSDIRSDGTAVVIDTHQNSPSS